MSEHTEEAKAVLLKIAAEIRENPARWTRGWFARTEEGFVCHPHDEGAKCWCLVGFIRKHLRPPNWMPGQAISEVERIAQERLKEVTKASVLVTWNDEQVNPLVVAKACEEAAA